MNLTLPKIYPITDRAISGLSHREQVAQLIEGGATLIQLREKLLPPREFFEDASEALHLARSAGVKLIINDRVDIAMAIRADGVHLGQTDIPVAAARRLLGDDAIIGYSTHNLAQVNEALRLPTNYLAFGPIFVTTTKENPDPVVGLDTLREIKSMARSLPIVAIGGITPKRIPEAFEAGADSVALISSVLKDGVSIAENLKKLGNITTVGSIVKQR